MRLFTGKHLAWTVVGMILAAAAPASAARIIDDFESYTGGNAISSSPSSTPWLRFGNGIVDDLYATTNAAYVIDGNLSAYIVASWASDNPNVNVRRHFATATDLSAYNVASLKIRSTAASSTARVTLSLTDGTGTYATTQSYALSDTAQTITFSLNPADMVRSDGSGSFETVIGRVTAIGIRVTNTKGTPNETIVVDDFVLDHTVPEPASGAMIVGGLLALIARRRR